MGQSLKNQLMRDKEIGGKRMYAAEYRYCRGCRHYLLTSVDSVNVTNNRDNKIRNTKIAV